MSVVRVSWPSARTRFGIVLAGLLLTTGCVPAKSTSALPQAPATGPSLSGSDAITRRLSSLGRESDNLASDAKLLPGRDAPDHVRIMQRIFADLLNTLPLLAEPGDNPRLSLHLDSIRASSAQLAKGSAELRIEPVIDTALREAGAALLDISDSYKLIDPASGEGEIGPALDKLSAEFSRLDVERNADLHRVDVAEAVDQINLVVSKLATTLSRRLTAEQPGGAPATQPAAPASPASQPATPPDGK